MIYTTNAVFFKCCDLKQSKYEYFWLLHCTGLLNKNELLIMIDSIGQKINPNI